MQACIGDELYNYLINNGRLTVDKTKRIFAQLVGAVSYVHFKNCVHRDLKLENILLDRNENVCFPFADASDLAADLCTRHVG